MNFQRLLALWTNLSFNQKILLGTLCLAAIIAGTVFYVHSQQDYDVMLSGLDETDAAAVVHNLRKQGTPYKLAESGTTILVPSSRKEELRLDAFKDDLIKSEKTVGFGALGSLPFGLTDWQQKKYDQKIISDEVVSTLERIQGIKKARVILAQSEESLFNTDKIDPTASVMLIVEPGFRLKTEQVRTIRAIVSHSVPNLKPENVAISDSLGNQLTDADTGSLGADSDSPLRQFEKQKSKDVLEMLTPVVGANNAVVKISAVMNFDRSESRIKRYIPAGGSAESPTGIPVSVQQTQEISSSQGKDAKPSGQPGIAAAPTSTSGTPTYGTQESGKSKPGETGTGSGGSDYRNQQTTTNYEISSEEKTIVHAPGSVERMSVAVVVNKVLTETETKELTTLVASASGADFNRGDTIAVSGLQFAPELKEQEKAAMDAMQQSEQQAMIMGLVQMAGIFVLAIAALFVLYKLLNRPIEGELVGDEGYALGGGGGGGGGYPALTDSHEPLMEPSKIPTLEAKLDPEIEQMREAINTMVNRDPSEAARVLVTFMKDM